MIKINLKDIILIGLVVLILIGNVGDWLGWKNDGVRIETNTVTNTVVRIDTVERIIETIIIKEPIITNLTREIKIPYIVPHDTLNEITGQDSIVYELPINIYQDTLSIDGAELSYRHEIAGYLQGSSFGIRYPKQTITITDSIFVNTTQVKNRIFDVFLVGGYQFKPNRSYTIGGDFVTKKWKVGLNVGYQEYISQSNNIELEPTMSATVGIRLFGY